MIPSAEFRSVAGPARGGALGLLAALFLSGTAPPAEAQWRQPSPWGYSQPAYYPSYPPGYQPGWQQRDYYQRPDYQRPDVQPRPDIAGPARKAVAKKPKKKETDKVERAAAPKGPLHIIVSIGSQRVKVYDGNVVIAEAPISTGTATHPTPMGVFSIIQKNRFHRSNLYSDAPMPFMQRLTWSGVALHEGKLPGYPASHGCIRLPSDFAQKLWGMTKLGVRVIVAPSDVAPVEITHATLFTRKLQAPTEQIAQLRPSIVDDGRDQLIQPTLIAAAEPIRTADAATTTTDGRAAETDAGAGDEPILWKVKPIKSDSAASGKSPPLRAGPVSVFVSRKEGRLFVRKGFATVFDVPVTIRDPQAAIGTHVFTAVATAESGPAMRWVAITLPSDGDGRVDQAPQIVRISARDARGREPAGAAHVPSTKAAQRALDRIEIPADAAERIGEMLAPGASFIISDHGRGDETGLETDFIVVTR